MKENQAAKSSLRWKVSFLALLVLLISLLSFLARIRTAYYLTALNVENSWVGHNAVPATLLASEDKDEGVRFLAAYALKKQSRYSGERGREVNRFTS